MSRSAIEEFSVQRPVSLDGIDPAQLPIRISPPPYRSFAAAPRYQLPRGACDGHVHVLGPQKRFPLMMPQAVASQFADVVFVDSTVDDLVAMMDAVGLDRAIYTQTVMYGARYDTMIHALSRLPDRLRGVVIVDPEMTDRELEILKFAGVIGARMSAQFTKTIDDHMVGRVCDLGWSVHYLHLDWTGWEQQVLATPGKFIIEHTGMPDPTAGFDAPTFKTLLRFLDTGRCWIKLSPRFSHERDFPFADTLPYIRKLIEYAPNRMLWGSDWPHPTYFGRPMVSDVALIDLMLDWAEDASVRDRIMVENASEAYDWALDQ